MMEAWAPKKLAYDWDNVGLQIGSFQKPVRKVMVTLDVLESVVDEAVEKDVNLIIAHHPFMFKPMKQLNTDSDRKSTRLNSSHVAISYAVFCLKKKNTNKSSTH